MFRARSECCRFLFDVFENICIRRVDVSNTYLHITPLFKPIYDTGDRDLHEIEFSLSSHVLLCAGAGVPVLA
jgi:hypothetical protein